ncbi:hypothetical protein [Brachybacterium sp. FME24]|uniref:hypothetical protein n=1 Tax=Brachybacterium sp. FME24 TaxID=2742605 RepID=UPI001D05610F|nr:hypothetical protein [Brachybacterium sp. FME24]
MLKIITVGAIALLLAMRLLRGKFGATLLGVSVRVLNIAYLALLLITGILAGVFEQWVLLGVVVALLALSGVEEIRRRSAQKTPAPRPRTQR